MNEVPSTNWDPLTNNVWHWAHWPFFAKHFLSHSFSITLSLGKFSDVRKTPVGRYPVVGPVVGSRQHSLSHYFPVTLFLSFLRRYATPTTLLYFVVDGLDINICCRPKTWVVCGWRRHACERDDGERLLLSWEHKTFVLTLRPDNRGHVDVCWKLWKGVYVGQGWR